MRMPMIFKIDLDGILFTNECENWRKAKPRKEHISFINWLYEQGHTIIISTSRYENSPEDWLKDTLKQLKKYNVKYSRVEQKDYYDFMVDDKCLHSIDTLKIMFRKFTEIPWNQLG